MARSAVVRKDVLERSNEAQVCHLNIQLLAHFSHDSLHARFPKIDSTANGTKEPLILDHIVRLIDEDAAMMPKETQRERANSILRHRCTPHRQHGPQRLT